MSRLPKPLQGPRACGFSLPPRVVDFLVIVVLAVAALKANWRLECLVDINGWDETNYLAAGLELPRGGPPDARTEIFFAPLYSLWYYFLGLIESVPLRLIDLNFRILAVALPCSLYAMLRQAGCSILPAVSAAYLLIVNNLSLDPWTRSIHFGVLMLAFGIWGALCLRGMVEQACSLVLGSVAAAYARPEYMLLALGMSAVLVGICVFRRFHLARREWLWIAALILISIGCAAAFGLPMFAGNNRSFAALSQGFSWNYQRIHPSELNSWTDYKLNVEAVFGQCDSVTRAFLNNPKMFCWHVGTNFWGWLKGIAPAFLEHRSFLLPDGNRLQSLENALVFCLFLGFVFVRRRMFLRNARLGMKAFPLIAFFGVSAVFISTLGIMLTLVQARYFFPLVYLGLFAGSFCLGLEDQDENPVAGRSGSLTGLVFGGILLLGLTPASSLYEQRPTPLRTALTEVSRIKPTERTGYLEALADERSQVYLNPNLQFVARRNKREGENFVEFLGRNNIGIVHASSFLKQDRFFVNDTEWNEFLTNPEKFGFEMRQMPWHEFLYVKKALPAL